MLEVSQGRNQCLYFKREIDLNLVIIAYNMYECKHLLYLFISARRLGNIQHLNCRALRQDNTSEQSNNKLDELLQRIKTARLYECIEPFECVTFLFFCS